MRRLAMGIVAVCGAGSASVPPGSRRFYPWAKAIQSCRLAWMPHALSARLSSITPSAKGLRPVGTFKLMERRLLRGIINRDGLTWVSASACLEGFGFQAGWHCQDAAVLWPVAVHAILAGAVRKFAEDRNENRRGTGGSSTEIPTLLMIHCRAGCREGRLGFGSAKGRGEWLCNCLVLATQRRPSSACKPLLQRWRFAKPFDDSAPLPVPMRGEDAGRPVGGAEITI